MHAMEVSFTSYHVIALMAILHSLTAKGMPQGMRQETADNPTSAVNPSDGDKRLARPHNIPSWVLHKDKYPAAGGPPAGHGLPHRSVHPKSIGQRLVAAEARIMQKVDAKLEILNQSVLMTHLLKLHHYVLEELQVVQGGEEGHQRELNGLHRKVDRQEDEVRRLRGSLQAVQARVANLTQLVGRRGGREDGPQHGAHTTPTPPAPTHLSGFKPLFPVDCSEVYEQGSLRRRGARVFMLQPTLSPRPFKAACVHRNNTGWTLIQHRHDGTVDFYRTWEEYKRGFGDLSTEFWLGNEHIYQLTNQGNYMLRLEMTDWDDRKYWAEYDHFRVSAEDELYRLHVHGYHGDAGDSLTSSWDNHDDQPFSTKDRDNDDRFHDNCARDFHGAWWFTSCFDSHLNGVYYDRGSHNNFFVRNGIQWNSIHFHASLKEVAMMTRPNPKLIGDPHAGVRSNQIE